MNSQADAIGRARAAALEAKKGIPAAPEAWYVCPGARGAHAFTRSWGGHEMTHYPNNPADWTDGDWEMAALEKAAAKSLANRKAGRCDHGWSGPDNRPGADKAVFICYHCQHVFGTRSDRDREMGWDR